MVQTCERTSLNSPDRFTLQLRNTLCLDTCVSLMFRTWSSSDIVLDQIACLVQTWDERYIHHCLDGPETEVAMLSVVSSS